MQKKKREKKHSPALVSRFNYGFCQLNKRNLEKLEKEGVGEIRQRRMGVGEPMMVEPD